MGKKLRRRISISSTCLCHCRKHTNNDNNICPLALSACFQEHNSDIKKLEWTPLFLTSTKSVICQMDANSSSFQSLNILPFQIRPGRLKLAYYSLISNYSRYCSKTSSIWFLFLSSHVFTALEFDSNHFGILLWKIVKPRDHNEIKPPIAKIVRKYKPTDIKWLQRDSNPQPLSS